MRSRGWLALGAAGVLVCAALVGTSAADAGTTVPDGGGWAHAGAAPGSRTRHAEAAPAGYPGYGIDVSSHDHPTADINWAGVATGGTPLPDIQGTRGPSHGQPEIRT